MRGDASSSSTALFLYGLKATRTDAQSATPWRSRATPIRGAVTARLDTVTPWPVMSHSTEYGSFT